MNATVVKDAMMEEKEDTTTKIAGMANEDEMERSNIVIVGAGVHLFTMYKYRGYHHE